MKNAKPGVAYSDEVKAKVKAMLKTMTNKAIMRKLGGTPTSHWIGRFRRSLKVADVSPVRATKPAAKKAAPKPKAKAQKPAKAEGTAKKAAPKKAAPAADTSIL